MNVFYGKKMVTMMITMETMMIMMMTMAMMTKMMMMVMIMMAMMTKMMMMMMAMMTKMMMMMMMMMTCQLTWCSSANTWQGVWVLSNDELEFHPKTYKKERWRYITWQETHLQRNHSKPRCLKCDCTFFSLSWKLLDTQIRLRWPI